MRVLPEKKHSLPTQPSGIGSGGMVPFEDDVSSLPFLAPLVVPLLSSTIWFATLRLFYLVSCPRSMAGAGM